MTKLIAVCGATGNQGGSVVDALLKCAEFRVRGLTRRLDSEKAQALTKRGVEMVCADFNKKETLVEAFKGAHGVYLVTNFWDTMDPEKERGQAEALVDAAKEAGVQHVVWSTLEDTTKFEDNIPRFNGVKVAFYDTKGKIDKYIESLGIPATYLCTCLYYEAFLGPPFKVAPSDDGVYRLRIPVANKKWPMVCLKDIGEMVAAVLKKGHMGRVTLCSAHLSGQDLADGFKNATGKDFRYEHISADEYRAPGFPMDAVGNMFEVYATHSDFLCKDKDLGEVGKWITPTNFQEWCKQNADKLL